MLDANPSAPYGEGMSVLEPNAELADVFVLLADSLGPDNDLVDTLDVLVQAATSFTSAVDAGILLQSAEGTLHIVASTSERASDIEEAQIGALEGPCLVCVQSGELVEVPDISRSQDRWPNFAATSESRGLRAAHAVPMRLRTRVLGGMNLFSDQLGLFDDRDAALSLALAQLATISIIQSRTIESRTTVSAELQRALESRVIIEQAKGVVAYQRGIGMDGAFALLRNHARSNNLGIRAFAERVVNRKVNLA